MKKPKQNPALLALTKSLRKASEEAEALRDRAARLRELVEKDAAELGARVAFKTSDCSPTKH